MIFDDNGTFLTERVAPKMALIQPRISGDQLVLSAPGIKQLNIY